MQKSLSTLAKFLLKQCWWRVKGVINIIKGFEKLAEGEQGEEGGQIEQVEGFEALNTKGQM